MLLEGYRVLDLTNEWGLLAGKLLADLGAEVVAVEPPGGNGARRLGPFFGGEPGHSLYWMAYAAGKTGITLALDTIEGPSLLRQLVAVSDVLLESFPPGHLAGLGLDYERLVKDNPSLVGCAITPFGQKGPYAGHQATDLTVVAAGGLAYVTGDKDRPPVRIAFPQSPLIAGSAAAAGVAIAMFHRTRTGEGQFIDISAQQAVARSLDRTPAFWDIEGTVLKRTGSYGRTGGGTLRKMTWTCRDGYLAFFLLGGMAGARNMEGVVQWMHDIGFDPGPLKEIQWGEMDFFRVPQDVMDRVSGVLETFFANVTKKEAWGQAQERKLLLYPVSDPSEVYRQARDMYPDLFHSVPYPELGTSLEQLGPFLSGNEAAAPAARAPALGEHNREVYRELLGIAWPQLDNLHQRGVV